MGSVDRAFFVAKHPSYKKLYTELNKEEQAAHFFDKLKASSPLGAGLTENLQILTSSPKIHEKLCGPGGLGGD